MTNEYKGLFMHCTWKFNAFLIHIILHIDLFLPNTIKNSSYLLLSAYCVPGTFLNAFWISVYLMLTKICEVFTINNLRVFLHENTEAELLTQGHIDYKWGQWDLNLSSQTSEAIFTPIMLGYQR